MLTDLRYGLRLSRKNPGATFLGIAALALAIGLTSAMFSILYGSFWKPLPLPEAERLVRVERSGASSPGFDWASVEALSESQESLEQMVPWFASGDTFSGDGGPATVYDGAYVVSEFFPAVGVAPLAGRGLTPADDVENAPLSVVLGHSLWMKRYGGDPSVLGKSIKVGGEPATIVGIMPRGFAFPLNQEYWFPLGHILPAVRQSEYLTLDVFGRLKKGVKAGEAQAELQLLASRSGGQDPIAVSPFVLGYTKSNRRPLWLMAGGVLGVLLIGCANVTNLLLARWAVRRRELALRTALGAPRWRLARQMLADALGIAGLGGLGGVGIAKLVIDLYNAEGGLVQTFWVDVRLSPLVLLAVVAVTLAAALFSGLLPALVESRLSNLGTLKDQAHGSTGRQVGRTGEWLMAGQVALSCALLMATLLMIGSVRNLESEEFGEEPEAVWTAQVMIDTTVYGRWRDWLRFYDQLTDRLRAVPGVSSVALATHLPSGQTRRMAVEVEGAGDGREADLPTARWSVVSPEFFETFGRPIVLGRGFSSSDTVEKEPVVVINESFAKSSFPTGASPLGRRLRLKDPKFGELLFTVVGVAPDLYLSWDYFSDRVDREHPEGLYLAVAQNPPPGLYVVIRSGREAAGVTREVRRVLAEFSPDMPLLHPATMAGRIDDLTARYRMVRTAFAVFGTSALGLAAIGLFGLASFHAAQRGREFAVHMALGARPWNVVRLAMGGIGARTTAGVLVGLGVGLALSRLLQAFLYDIETVSLAGWTAVVAATLFLVVAVACFRPTRRSVLLDPAAVLRGE